jgi:intracellular sulfur oxidation DsrE/DsrF family protein
MPGRKKMRTGFWCLVLLAAGVLAWSAAEASHAADQPKRENHVNVVGRKNIEAFELVVHGPALRTFLAKDMDPDVRGKLEALLAVKDLIQGATPVPSGVVRVMELQEAGYAYIRP